MDLKRKSTATAVRPSAQGEEFARVTIAIMETGHTQGYLRSVCRAGEADLKGPNGSDDDGEAGSGAPAGESFEACESAIFSGALYALRTGSGLSPDRVGMVILDVAGCVGTGGAHGFALAAAYAVWNTFDYTPAEGDVTEIEGWRFDGVRDVTDAARFAFPGPTTIDSDRPC